MMVSFHIRIADSSTWSMWPTTPGALPYSAHAVQLYARSRVQHALLSAQVRQPAGAEPLGVTCTMQHLLAAAGAGPVHGSLTLQEQLHCPVSAGINTREGDSLLRLKTMPTGPKSVA